ncbi:hypothetical protein HYC85_011152, partial [Camellia sinensis]
SSGKSSVLESVVGRTFCLVDLELLPDVLLSYNFIGLMKEENMQNSCTFQKRSLLILVLISLSRFSPNDCYAFICCCEEGDRLMRLIERLAVQNKFQLFQFILVYIPPMNVAFTLDFLLVAKCGICNFFISLLCLCGFAVVNLTLIDLPGLTKVAIDGQSESIVQDIENMVQSYIEKPNCIILAISPANQDLATSDAIKISREVDPKGERTFGVLTKIDLMDKGTDAVEHLEHVIKSRIPGLQSLISKSIIELETELSRLGKPVATDAGGKLYMTMEICRVFDGIFKEHLDGTRAGGDKIYSIFDSQLPAALKRLQFDKHLSLDNVRKLITEADGYQPHLIAPEQGYRRLIESTLVTIKGPAEAAVDAELKQYPTLRVEVANAACEALERMKEESKKATLQLVEMEYSYLTIDFFRKLPQDVEKGGNPTNSIFDRYNDAYLRRIGSTVLSYVNMVCAGLRNSIPKSVVYCQVREAKRSLLDHFFAELGTKEVKQLGKLLDEDPAIMQRRVNLAKRLELYRAAQSEIEAVAWSK